MSDNQREQAEIALNNAKQRLQQEDTPENRKAVEDAQAELDRINQQSG